MRLLYSCYRPYIFLKRSGIPVGIARTEDRFPVQIQLDAMAFRLVIILFFHDLINYVVILSYSVLQIQVWRFAKMWVREPKLPSR